MKALAEVKGAELRQIALASLSAQQPRIRGDRYNAEHTAYVNH
ncbi:hypothetical protein ACSBOX_11300 [Arthrobacter sp. KN11-1C]